MPERLFVLLCAALAGGVGAVARFVLDGVVTAALARRAGGIGGAGSASVYPWGITAVNLSGSFAIGVLGGAVAATNPLVTVLGVGLLGGYTTFSTASVDTVRLLRSGRVLAGTVNGVGQLVAAVLAAALGAWIGSILA